MKHTKNNVLKVLKAKEDNVIALYMIAEKENDEESAKRLLREFGILDSCIEILTNKGYFEEQATIYGITE